MSKHDHNSPELLSRVSLYEAMLTNPRLLPFLGFPPGVLLEAGDEQPPKVFRGDQLQALRAGSHVEAVLTGRLPTGSS